MNIRNQFSLSVAVGGTTSHTAEVPLREALRAAELNLHRERWEESYDELDRVCEVADKNSLWDILTIAKLQKCLGLRTQFSLDITRQDLIEECLGVRDEVVDLWGKHAQSLDSASKKIVLSGLVCFHGCLGHIQKMDTYLAELSQIVYVQNLLPGSVEMCLSLQLAKAEVKANRPQMALQRISQWGVVATQMRLNSQTSVFEKVSLCHYFCVLAEALHILNINSPSEESVQALVHAGEIAAGLSAQGFTLRSKIVAELTEDLSPLLKA